MKSNLISIRKATHEGQATTYGVDLVAGPGAPFPQARTREGAIQLAMNKAKELNKRVGRAIHFIEELGRGATKFDSWKR